MTGVVLQKSVTMHVFSINVLIFLRLQASLSVLCLPYAFATVLNRIEETEAEYHTMGHLPISVNHTPYFSQLIPPYSVPPLPATTAKAKNS